LCHVGCKTLTQSINQSWLLLLSQYCRG